MINQKEAKLVQQSQTIQPLVISSVFRGIYDFLEHKNGNYGGPQSFGPENFAYCFGCNSITLVGHSKYAPDNANKDCMNKEILYVAHGKDKKFLRFSLRDASALQSLGNELIINGVNNSVSFISNSLGFNHFAKEKYDLGNILEKWNSLTVPQKHGQLNRFYSMQKKLAEEQKRVNSLELQLGLEGIEKIKMDSMVIGIVNTLVDHLA
jgi:hypothetical protein